MIVYLTTNKINKKKYIGADSKNDPNYLGSGDFIKKAIKRYGKENFIKEVLEKCNSWEELMQCEEKWCKQFNVKENPQFYNCTNKGKGSKPGRKVNDNVKNIIRKKNSKNVFQYDLEGNLIQEWGSLSQVKKTLKLNISSSLRGITKTCGGYIWKYQKTLLSPDELLFIKSNKMKGQIRNEVTRLKMSKSHLGVPKSESHKDKLSQSLKGRKCDWDTSSMREKPVSQYDLKDNFIRDFSSAQEACLFLNLSTKVNILSCCRNNQKTAYGFKWKFKN
jgi:group I intron endonuclease